MNKKTEQIILLIWIAITSLLDISIGIFAFSLLGCVNCTSDGSPDYNLSIYLKVFNQVMMSLLVFVSGLFWSAIILFGTEQFLVFLKIPTPGNNKFSKFSLGIFKIALIIMLLSLLFANLSAIYTQMQGRGGFRS